MRDVEYQFLTQNSQQALMEISLSGGRDARHRALIVSVHNNLPLQICQQDAGRMLMFYDFVTPNC